MKHCQARQYSDQMMCPRCGLAWDVNDPDPPQCSDKNILTDIKSVLSSSTQHTVVTPTKENESGLH